MLDNALQFELKLEGITLSWYNQTMSIGMKTSRKPTFTIGNHEFYIPKQDKNGKQIPKSAYSKFEKEFRDIIRELEQLAGKDNIEVIVDPTLRTGRLIFAYKHNNYDEFKKQIEETNFRQNYSSQKLSRYDMTNIGPEYNRMFSIDFDKSSLLITRISLPIINLYESKTEVKTYLKRTEKYQGISSVDFVDMLKQVRKEIDNLLKTAQVQVNEKNRVNFYSLFDGNFIFRLGNVSKFTKITRKEHSQLNPQLATIAAQGINADFLLMLYINNYYPKSNKEVQDLLSLPYSWLNSALSGD